MWFNRLPDKIHTDSQNQNLNRLNQLFSIKRGFIFCYPIINIFYFKSNTFTNFIISNVFIFYQIINLTNTDS